MAIVVSLARRAACCSAFSISALPTPVLVPLSPDGNQMNGLKAVFAAFEREPLPACRSPLRRVLARFEAESLLEEARFEPSGPSQGLP